MISGSVTLTQPVSTHKQFIASDNRGHHLILDDAAGNTGPKPIELVAIGLAGCTAFDVIGILRKKRQEVTGYEVRVEAEQTPASAAGLHSGADSPHRDRAWTFPSRHCRTRSISRKRSIARWAPW